MSVRCGGAKGNKLEEQLKLTAAAAAARKRHTGENPRARACMRHSKQP